MAQIVEVLGSIAEERRHGVLFFARSAGALSRRPQRRAGRGVGGRGQGQQRLLAVAYEEEVPRRRRELSGLLVLHCVDLSLV